VVALTVSFTVCDAQQISVPSSDLLSSVTHFTSFQMERDAQKSPYDLNITRLGQDGRLVRALTSSPERFPAAPRALQYVLSSAFPWTHPFCWQVNSCESPRAPPLMDPPQLS
jgi:hypothetical protein